MFHSLVIAIQIKIRWFFCSRKSYYWIVAIGKCYKTADLYKFLEIFFQKYIISAINTQKVY
ncbi:unnamed protein product [Commensalibacter communis]|uniref:Uncharacterized protein n=1 Tax=Commensalibacter communis TaxID=2972786 RepID=A0A9W4XAG7_9PROT|nr:unnamed protein product [Commensalibacter communis]CAI3956032.1 unnamed protein product [Commensalibacter communis]CAI3957055.1 unnamed protein product [Commensalibacter communis]CAI3958742.1 unnamed protein product [Commensalibacter communis]CAI3959106.1 unnamed protein product [Commensalibacter communis]